MYALIDEPPGYTEVRYNVVLESPASEEDINRVLETAERYSPWRTIFATPQNLKRTVKVLSPEKE